MAGGTDIFVGFLLVVVKHEELEDGTRGKPAPHIAYRYPPKSKGNDADPIPPNCGEFCFPDASAVMPTGAPPQDRPTEAFSFTLTQTSGERIYGFCRRVLPRAEDGVPLCLCVLSKQAWFSFFSEVLEILYTRYRRATKPTVALRLFLESLQRCPFPLPAESFVVRARWEETADGEDTPYWLVRPDEDHSPHDIDYQILFTHLDITNVLTLFAALLCEKRVIITGKSLHALSGTINALVATLYPFHWPHIFIPILPPSLLAYVCAPMPFLVGLQDRSDLDKQPIEQVVFVDIDLNQILITTNDILPLPPRLLFTLQQSLDKVVRNFKKTRTFDNKSVTAAFLSFFVNIFGDYRQFINPGGDGALVFDMNAFAGEKSKAEMKFLEVFEESQMFEQFRRERIDMCRAGYPGRGMFEREVSLMEESRLLNPSGSRGKSNPLEAMSGLIRSTVKKTTVTGRKQGVLMKDVVKRVMDANRDQKQVSNRLPQGSSPKLEVGTEEMGMGASWSDPSELSQSPGDGDRSQSGSVEGRVTRRASSIHTFNELNSMTFPRMHQFFRPGGEFQIGERAVMRKEVGAVSRPSRPSLAASSATYRTALENLQNLSSSEASRKNNPSESSQDSLLISVDAPVRPSEIMKAQKEGKSIEEKFKKVEEKGVADGKGELDFGTAFGSSSFSAEGSETGGKEKGDGPADFSSAFADSGNFTIDDATPTTKAARKSTRASVSKAKSPAPQTAWETPEQKKSPESMPQPPQATATPVGTTPLFPGAQSPATNTAIPDAAKPFFNSLQQQQQMMMMGGAPNPHAMYATYSAPAGVAAPMNPAFHGRYASSNFTPQQIGQVPTAGGMNRASMSGGAIGVPAPQMAQPNLPGRSSMSVQQPGPAAPPTAGRQSLSERATKFEDILGNFKDK